VKKIIAILLLIIITSQLVVTGMKHTVCCQELLVKFEDKSEGDKTTKDVKAEKKDSKEYFAHAGSSSVSASVLKKSFNRGVLGIIPHPVFEKQTPPPDFTC